MEWNWGGAADIAITNLHPAGGPTHGRTAVTVTGTSFEPNITCRFGGVFQDAVTFVSASLVECGAPPHVPGSVALELSNNGNQDYTTLFTLYSYYGTAGEGERKATCIRPSFIRRLVGVCRSGAIDGLPSDGRTGERQHGSDRHGHQLCQFVRSTLPVWQRLGVTGHLRVAGAAGVRFHRPKRRHGHAGGVEQQSGLHHLCARVHLLRYDPTPVRRRTVVSV